jgi:hypothetical protein
MYDTTPSAQLLRPTCRIAIPAVVMILGMGFIPESPKWLVQHNRLADAKDTLRHLRPKAHDIDAEVIRTSLVLCEE